MKLRLYFDTSVFSLYHDVKSPDRQSETQLFWARLGEFEIATSELAREELSLTPDAAKRQLLLDLLPGFVVYPLTQEMKDLAHRYVAGGAFSAAVFNDALHVAAAVQTRQDLLISWNFKHLVNRRRRAKVNEINVSMGLPSLEIVSPPEV